MPRWLLLQFSCAVDHLLMDIRDLQDRRLLLQFDCAVDHPLKIVICRIGVLYIYFCFPVVCVSPHGSLFYFMSIEYDEMKWIFYLV